MNTNIKQIDQPVRQTEMSKAICGLFSAIDILNEKFGILRDRIACVSMSKPKNPITGSDGPSLPQHIQEIRTAEYKIQSAYQLVNEMLDDLEI